MKTLLPFIAFAVILLFGCAKEEVSLAADENQQAEESIIYVFDIEADVMNWRLVSPDELLSMPSIQSNSGNVSTRNNNSVHMHGEVPFFEFSATVNDGGTHGGATMYLGPFTFTSETDCIISEGNSALYGGLITAIDGPPGPFQVGWKTFFKVIDNGQGNNAPADQFYGVISFSPDPTVTCDDMEFPPFIFDVPEPYSVKINN